jgi:hypothetical protein
MVTVAGRGVGPGPVQLGPVADLEPYLRGRSETLGRLAERLRQRPSPVLEPAEGVAAYRALAEAALGSQAQNLAALRAGRVPRHGAGEGATMHALWQRAVREQARISGIGADRADEMVTLVVNHLAHLEEEAPWFTAEPRLREAAQRCGVLARGHPVALDGARVAEHKVEHASVADARPTALYTAPGSQGGRPLVSERRTSRSARARRQHSELGPPSITAAICTLAPTTAYYGL